MEKEVMKNADSQSYSPNFGRFFPFKKYRENQEEVILKIIEAFNTKKFVVLDAPTGSGKSAIGITVARFFNSVFASKTHYLTIQKILQDQYKKEFPELYPMKGRGNFTCLLNGQSCAKGVCRKKKIKACRNCPYKMALNKAVVSPMTLHNFDSFYYQKFVYNNRKLMVIDEAHNIENKFMSFISFTIDNKLIPFNIPEHDTMEKYRSMVEEYYSLVKSYIIGLESRKEKFGLSDDDIDLLDELTRIEEKTRRFLDTDVRFVFERKIDGPTTKVIFKPIEVGPFTHIVYDYADNILLMSATCLNKEQFARNNGIPIDEMEYVEIPSTFPIENRPIYATNELDLTYKKMNDELPKIPKIINRYLREYEGERGIIHTHTNKLVYEIKKGVRSNRLLFKDDFVSVNTLLEAHARREDSVIVASGFHEGLDLKDDLSRLQLILKVPYPSLADQQLKARMEVDKDYYQYLTSLKIIQSYGRSVRSKDDWCDSYILDKNFIRFKGMAKKFLPTWFVEAIEIL